MTISEIKEKYKVILNQLEELEKSYKNKNKGKAYNERRLQLVDKLKKVRMVVRERAMGDNIMKVMCTMKIPVSRGVKEDKEVVVFLIGVDMKLAELIITHEFPHLVPKNYVPISTGEVYKITQ